MAAQVYVTKYFGESSPQGFVNAEVGMVTNLGHIMGISGEILHIGSGSSEPHVTVPDDTVFIEKAHAEALWSWPTGVLCFPVATNDIYPSSTAKARNSGFIVVGAGGPVLSYR